MPTAQQTKTYLALGDSYTIGEKVPARDNFPNQLINILRQKGHPFDKPLIIAKTGWTTDELWSAIEKSSLEASFDLVTLLIGVNNQYRGRSVEEYALQFQQLLTTAVRFAAGRPKQVVVLSIPDWGATPFATGKDRDDIRQAIDLFNETNQEISLKQGVHYIEITEGTRAHASMPGMLTDDGLHPSAKEYHIWAEKVASLNLF